MSDDSRSKNNVPSEVKQQAWKDGEPLRKGMDLKRGGRATAGQSLYAEEDFYPLEKDKQKEVDAQWNALSEDEKAQKVSDGAGRIKNFHDEYKDNKKAANAAYGQAGAEIAKDVATLPTGMLIGLFKAFEQNGGKWPLMIKFLQLIEKAISVPFDMALSRLDKVQEDNGNPGFLEEKHRQDAKAEKRREKEASKENKGPKPEEKSIDKRVHADMKNADPDQDGKVNAGSSRSDGYSR